MGLEDLRKKLNVKHDIQQINDHFIPSSVHNRGLRRYEGPYLFDVLFDIAKSKDMSLPHLMQRWHMSAQEAVSWVQWLKISLFAGDLRGDGSCIILEKTAYDSLFDAIVIYLDIKYQVYKDSFFHPFGYTLIDIMKMYPNKDLFSVSSFALACHISENRALDVIKTMCSVSMCAPYGNGLYRFAITPTVWQEWSDIFDKCIDADIYPHKDDGLTTFDLIGLDYCNVRQSLFVRSVNFFETTNDSFVTQFYVMGFKAIVTEDIMKLDAFHVICQQKYGSEGNNIFSLILDAARIIGLLRSYSPYQYVLSNMNVDELELKWSTYLSLSNA